MVAVKYFLFFLTIHLGSAEENVIIFIHLVNFQNCHQQFVGDVSAQSIGRIV